MITSSVRTIIVEDEPPARMKLAAFIERCPELELIQTFADGNAVIEFLRQNQIDLMFLDIHMDGISGIQVLEQLQHPPGIIITSAYEEYALKGFEYNVTDYLLKPYSFDRFRKGIEKVLRDLSLKRMEVREEDQYILIKSEYRLEKIELSSIIFIEGMKDYLRIHTDTRKIMTLRSFSSIAQELPADQFVRIHKSFMIALSHLTAIEKDFVVIGANYRIPIGRSYKERFLEQVHRAGISAL